MQGIWNWQKWGQDPEFTHQRRILPDPAILSLPAFRGLGGISYRAYGIV